MLGGCGDTPEQSELLWDYVFGVVGTGHPRMLFLPTATGDSDEAVVVRGSLRTLAVAADAERANRDVASGDDFGALREIDVGD